MIAPKDAEARRAIAPVIVYPPDTLPPVDTKQYRTAVAGYELTSQVLVPPREGGTFRVPSGGAFRITSVDGPQVGDLNLFHANDLTERFFSGKTRAIHGTHVNEGDHLWSVLNY